MLGGVLERIRRPSRPRAKHASELAFWRSRLVQQGDLAQVNELYARYFVELFAIPAGFYAGKRMLDIGCGPRGSLEWATEAAERVGLDPLADDYVRLHERPQAMRYVRGDAEAIPFADGHFDVVSTYNSIDHVDDLDASIAEIERVTAPGGLLLLIVDVNHEPTPTEPQRLGWDLLERFSGFRVAERRE
ncbi:MAG: hypothetical protein JWM73_1021 [Solirubrobacterales bacterium]|nr:hypothetical protein [Solirubrobacterales bacterium]